MTSPEPTPETLRAIYEEAQQLRAQLESLIARLQPLVEPAAAQAQPGATPRPETPPAPTSNELPTAASPGAAPAALPKNAILGPLVFVASGDKRQLLHPLGISPEGRPLLEIDARAAAAFARDTFSAESKEQIALYRNKRQSRVAHLGVVEGISAAALDQSRWAVVINALEDSALIKALWPLIEHRMGQMQLKPPAVSFKDGENAGAWLNRHTDGGKQNLKDHWGQIPPVLLYRPGERAGQWLARHGVAQGPVDPRRGVPYYLLVAGRPGPLRDDDEAYIPMNFQYLLDIFWGVGRLCFTDETGKHRLTDYTAYAQHVISFEQARDARDQVAKEVVYFSTRHEADIATMRSTDELVLPLTRWHENPANVPAKQGVALRTFLEEQATKANLGQILNVGGGGKPPAILFTAGHGLGLPLSDARLVLKQGALVTQDWSGVGPVRDTHWFAGDDVGAAKLAGMFAFLFACYGAGCPDRDEFIFDPALGAEEGRPRIAPFALIAQLPQRLLANGALGVIGHVERAWTYSFTGTEDVKGQSQPFEDVLGRLLNGRRAGDATDQFNVIQGDRAMTLTEELENIKFGKQVEEFELARLWMARNDARNYALLGDPAARLPFAEGA